MNQRRYIKWKPGIDDRYPPIHPSAWMEGDGPGFPQEKVSFTKALPRGDMVLDLGDGNWTQLYPFIVASNYHHCRYRETYFVDRWNDRKGTAVMKSFERGHTEEMKDISSTLAALAETQ